MNKKRSYGLLQYVPIASANTPDEDWVLGGTAPQLFVQGLDDAITPIPSNILELKEEFGDRVELVQIPRAGHEMVDEQPEAVLEAVARFLKSL